MAPASAEALGAWIGAFWSGMELEMLLDIDDESEDHHREAVQAMQELWWVQLGEKESTPLPRRSEEGDG